MTTGTAADDNDIWLHQILIGKATGTDPRIKPRYIENEIDVVAASDRKPWEAEISGRLLSLCPDVEPFATNAAQAMGGRPAFYLRGLALALPTTARKAGFDVIIEPTPLDAAHAVLTIPKMEFAETAGGGKRKISQDLLRKITAVLRFCDPTQVTQLESEAGKPPDAANIPSRLATLDAPAPPP